jgi:tRNA U54 and U55 pseudouridine synthase Pus10
LESTIQVPYVCTICQQVSNDKSSLVEHLTSEHEILEIASFAAETMMSEQERDRIAKQFHHQFEQIKRDLAERDLAGSISE